MLVLIVSRDMSRIGDRSKRLRRVRKVYRKEEPMRFKSFSWDWPFCHDGVAKGTYTAEAFTVCLPFNNGGTGESRNTTRKFEKISESNFSWQVGLSNTSQSGNCFWRMELEVIRSLNMLVLIVSRDISRIDDRSKRLRRVRKVYRLPDYYDVNSISTKSYDFGIVLTANKLIKKEPSNNLKLQRADTVA
uniref:MATH domain-containing protein n=1 Tax=Rhabditophanes sp. KR3021 TaxID=114890 RepID=A0AC35TVM1_9BILA